ncbi:hypothetical protein [Candidatus Clostridium stratigraminis]|uniref:Uncharacterized protein n=1 Tax=Candidatus Clostridium stratigraminis TaxID=3381661 RepID=A0ABW8SYY2_9CLOT
MGTTFANMHIKNIKSNEVEILIPEILVKQYNPEWVTITYPNFQVGAIEKLAKKVSKKINNPVLTVEVIEEEILILYIFREGKAVASHVSSSGYGLAKNIGKASRFVKELEIQESYTDYFKWIFKCEAPDKALQLLEKVLVLPLWIDFKMIVEGYVDPENFKQDLGFVDRYIKEKKVSDKIKNSTKAKLLMEFDGKIYGPFGYRKYLVHKPSEDNNYHGFNDHYIYSAADNGELKCLFSVSMFNAGRDNSIFITNNNVIALVEVIPINIKRDKISYLLLNMNGDVIGATKLPKEAGYPISVFDDGSIIFKAYAPSSAITKYNIHGEQLPIDITTEYYERPVLKNGYIYLCHTNEKTKSWELIKRNHDGDTVAVLPLKERPKWKQFLFDREGNFYYCLESFDTGKYFEKLLYLDKDLNIKNEILLDVITNRALLDDANSKLYLSVMDKELLAIDLKDKNKIIRKKYEEDWYLSSLDSKGNIIIYKRQNTLEIFNPKLNIVSRHRLKGGIKDNYINADGNMCFVTFQMPYDAYTSDNVKSVIRVYEMVY